MKIKLGIGALALGLALAGAGCFPDYVPPVDLDAAVEVDGGAPDAAEPPADTATLTDGAGPDALDADRDAAAPSLAPPSGLAATTTEEAHVGLSWQPVPGATSYSVERCGPGDCATDEAWERLSPAPQPETRRLDLTAEGPARPAAPLGVSASADDSLQVLVRWAPVAAPEAPRYRYRVRAVGADGDGPPSAPVEGHRADFPISGYAVRVDGGPWQPAPVAAAPLWADAEAAPPTLEPGVASASEGTYAEFVRLALTGAAVEPGASRQYEVQALTALGAGPASAAVTGSRAAGTLAVRWERSADASAEAFAPIAGASGPTYDDADAPADGSVRYYRAVVSSPGAADAFTAPAPGARQPPPGVPGGVSASSDRADAVLVSWQPVSGAFGYHVWRDGVRLTAGAGVAGSTYLDTTADPPPAAWAAPSSVSASSHATDRVVVAWTAPPPPQGAKTTYQVQAVNAAGDGPLSAEASGRRQLAALVAYEVEVRPAGGSAAWVSTGEVAPSWEHYEAPLATLGEAAVSASAGDHRAHVALAAPIPAVGAAPTVTYRVRGRLADGQATPASASASGRRATGAVALQWQRSAGATAAAFADLAGATGAAFSDTGAPSDGTSRWYRLVASAPGAAGRIYGAVEGWRLAFTAVDAGAAHSCALSRDGEAWCWGSHAGGQLGRGDGITTGAKLPARTALIGEDCTSITVGARSSCVTRTTGSLSCWGSTYLGNGSRESSTIPISVSPLLGARSVVFADGGAGTAFGSFRYGCALMESSVVSCWGWGAYLGDALSDAEQLAPTPVRKGASSSSPILSGAVQVAALAAHACATLSAGSIWCWGNSEAGCLGASGVSGHIDYAVQASAISGAAEVAVGGSTSCARLDSGAVKCWGSAADGRLGDAGISSGGHLPANVAGIATAVQLSASLDSTCARLASGEVRCWGKNARRELGDGSTAASAGSPVAVALPSGTVMALGSGTYHHCAVVDHDVWCWGGNESGQLGDGTTTDQKTPVRVLFP